MTTAAQETTADRAEPTTLVEALARFNMTVDRALDLARRCCDGYDGGDYEYDQGDIVVVDFDDLYNLARVALASMALLRREALSDEPRKVEVHFRGGPWAGQTYEVERVVGPVFAVGDEIGNHYWLDSKSDPPTYIWDVR